MRNKQYLPKPVFAAVQKEVENIAKEVNGIKAIVIATIDGFDIISTSLDDTDPKRIAAMASSISAISHVVAQEAGLGYGKNIIILQKRFPPLCNTTIHLSLANPVVYIGKLIYHKNNVIRRFKTINIFAEILKCLIKNQSRSFRIIKHFICIYAYTISLHVFHQNWMINLTLL